MKKFAVIPVVLVFLLAGCSSPWKVIRQADPNPLKKDYPYFVNPVVFSNVQIGDIPESVYLRQLDPKSQEDWKLTKLNFSKAFQEAAARYAGNLKLVQKPTPQTFVILPEAVKIQRGDSDLPTSIKLKVSIKRKAKVYDVIEISTSVPASAGSFSERLKIAADKLAQIAMKYVNSRAN